MLHAGSHAFICGIGLLPVPAGSSHPYLIPARTHARIESPLCMLDPAHAWTRSTHARSPCVHALGPHTCTYTRRMTMRARTGSPRTNARTQDSHACTHRVPTHTRRIPMRTRTRSPRTHARTHAGRPCVHAPGPHARTHARRIPMRAHTRSPHTHAGSPCVHALGLHAHACTALILCPCTLDPHAHARPPCAYAHVRSPHARMHQVSPRMQACWIPMRARTRSSCTHAHLDLACTVYFGIALVVQ